MRSCLEVQEGDTIAVVGAGGNATPQDAPFDASMSPRDVYVSWLSFASPEHPFGSNGRLLAMKGTWSDGSEAQAPLQAATDPKTELNHFCQRYCQRPVTKAVSRSESELA